VGAKLVALKLVAVKVVTNNAVDVAFVVVTLVKIPVEGVEAPIGVLLMVPPLIVKPSTTNASVTEFVGSVKVDNTVKLLVVSTVELA
jgi:hypothetical protein